MVCALYISNTRYYYKGVQVLKYLKLLFSEHNIFINRTHSRNVRPVVRVYCVRNKILMPSEMFFVKNSTVLRVTFKSDLSAAYVYHRLTMCIH